MNDPFDDRELDSFLNSLPAGEREALLEEHRQLEKDLLRLADPLPPADFVQLVMNKVATAPAPVPAKGDIALALLITLGAFAAGVAAFFAHGGALDGVGLSVASLLVQFRNAALGLGGMLEAVWRTSAMPVSVALAATLVTSVLALKRLGTEAKVHS
jgi:hypothetical protein